MGLGLQAAGLRPTWAIDVDPHACATYERNLGAHAENARVEDVDLEALPAVDGLAFGFPCNDFSMIRGGTGKGGYFSGLYTEAVRALNVNTPDWFIAENVPGILSMGGTEIMGSFANAGPGYRVSVHEYAFEQYGVPQARRRVIGVGVRADLGLTFLPPEPTHPTPITASEALEGADELEHNNERTRHTARVIEMLRHIPPGANAWHENVPEHLRINTDVKLSLIYRRLHPDEPAYTVVGSGGGGTHMYHFAEPRALTNRERARLQTFPDDFVFCGGRGAVRKQIGMAVPPRAAEVIGRALLKTLAGENYPHTAPSVAVIEPGSAPAG